jgi:hypothetical protein
MSPLDRFKKKASAATLKIEKQMKKEREKLIAEAKAKVFLPFCKKHGLTLETSPFSTKFRTSSGRVLTACDLLRFPKYAEGAKEIQDWLMVGFMGDFLYEGDSADITEVD